MLGTDKWIHLWQEKNFTKTLEDCHEISDILFYAENALKDLNVADTFLIIQEDYSRHFHIWILPKYKWMDEKFGKGVSNLRDIIKYAKENVTDKDKEEIVNIANEVKTFFDKNFDKE